MTPQITGVLAVAGILIILVLAGIALPTFAVVYPYFTRLDGTAGHHDVAARLERRR